MAGQLRELHQVAQVERTVDVVDLPLLDLQAGDELRAQLGVDARADLGAHHLAEAPVAQLGLDGGEQVVGIVGHFEVGIAGDAETAGADHLHAGEEQARVGGDDLLDPDVRLLLAVDRDEPADHLARHLDARDHFLTALRIANERSETEREARDVREGSTDPDRERREHRQHLAAEAILDAGARLGVERVQRDDPDAVLGEPGEQDVAQLVVGASDLGLHEFAHTSMTSSGVWPSAPRSVTPAST